MPQTREEALSKRISDYKASARLRRACNEKAYYDTDNPDIMARRKYYTAAETVEGGDFAAVAKENRFAANEHVCSTFFQDITDGKVQYIAGEGADVNAATDDGAEAVQAVYRPIGDEMRRVEQETLTDALVFGHGYAYVQIINGRFSLSYVPYMEIIPSYDRYGELVGVTRYYERDGMEYAEEHTPKTVTRWERAKGDDKWTLEGERPQIIGIKVYPDGSAESVEARQWPRLPWVEMQQNKDGTSSLTTGAKSMIRVYDITASDFANNLIDVQDVFIQLKDSYGSGMDYGETLEMLRNFKASEGVDGVTTVDIPYEARRELLSMLKADIYAALRGVDVSLISGGQLTNTAIKALYTNIDLWADMAEWYLADWVRDVMGLAAWAAGVELPPYNVTFTRRAIFDDVAQMDAVARQKGVISDKTLYENHPLVRDAQEELERVAAEEAGAVYANGAGFDAE